MTPPFSKSFLILCILFSHILLFPQQKSKSKLPIYKVLKILEKRYNVSFSFVDETIENIFTDIPKKENTLEEVLSIIEYNSTLIFEILNDRFIAVKKEQRLPLPKVYFQELNEVSIMGYLTTGISKNKDGSLQLKTKDLGILPGLIEPDILQSVQALPGIVSASESISNLNIRGGTHDQNLILFDGIRMFKSGHFFGLITAFNPHLNYNINISKSASDVKFGENTSGVIDMQLPNKISDEVEVDAGFNLLSFDLLGTFPINKKIELQLAARRSTTDFLDTPTYNQYFNRAFQDADFNSTSNQGKILIKDEKFSFYDIYSKLIWNINDQNQLRFVFLNIENNLNYEETSVSTTEISLQQMDKLNQSNITSGITYEGNWSDEFKINTQVYFTRYDLFSVNENFVNSENLTQENEVIDIGFKLDTSVKISPKTNLSTGYQYSQTGISNSDQTNLVNSDLLFLGLVKQVLNTHTLYSQVNYSHSDFYFKAGVRANYYEKLSRLYIEPRLSLNYKFNDSFSFEINSSLKSQATSQIVDLDDDFLGIEKERWVLAGNNPITKDDFPIITSQQIGIGSYFKKNNWLISAEAYYKVVNGINSKSQAFQTNLLQDTSNNLLNFEKLSDIGSYRAKGIDILIHKKIKNIKTWLSYSYTTNDYFFDNLNKGERFPNNIDIRNVINLAGTYTYNNFDFALGFNWHSGKPFTPAIGVNNNNRINYEPINSGRLKDYLRLDTSVNYNFKIGNLDATSGISIWNILDRKNVLGAYYTLNNNFELVRNENTSLGLTPNLSFRVKF
ncbi:TonB-dependent receptor plug domain-containing protein [Tenacibaculum agarivorans]|uniref:TonB-dependent receptor plug domain-containing protein n=1 Tax=Tenacibaculum agarivorans TaxID=1908389 RepID=UPI00094B830A|nr:TonB-dependent receptor plug domain-containing protein [Tenacibaculum agarivorans]